MVTRVNIGMSNLASAEKFAFQSPGFSGWINAPPGDADSVSTLLTL
jgi:hypothetical protein